MPHKEPDTHPCLLQRGFAGPGCCSHSLQCRQLKLALHLLAILPSSPLCHQDYFVIRTASVRHEDFGSSGLSLLVIRFFGRQDCPFLSSGLSSGLSLLVIRIVLSSGLPLSVMKIFGRQDCPFLPSGLSLSVIRMTPLYLTLSQPHT